MSVNKTIDLCVRTLSDETETFNAWIEMLHACSTVQSYDIFESIRGVGVGMMKEKEASPSSCISNHTK